MQYSENLKLHKPERTDQYNLDDWNENTDILDTEVNAIRTELDNKVDEYDNAMETDVNDNNSVVGLKADGKVTKTLWSKVWEWIKCKLATVATSGNYNDLSGRPSLATVATSGSYNDLSNKPTKVSEFQNDNNYYYGLEIPSPNNVIHYAKIQFENKTISSNSPVIMGNVYNNFFIITENSMCMCNQNYGLTGVYYPIYTSNDSKNNIFYLKYQGYRTIQLLSAAKMKLIETSTVAPNGITFESPFYIKFTNGVLDIANGGTNASNAADARKNLGLGSSSSLTAGTAPGNVPVIVNELKGLDNNIVVTDQNGNLKTANKTPITINGGYLYSSSDPSLSTKIINLPGFSLYDGARISVLFLTTNTSETTKLNVNNTGDKSVYVAIHGSLVNLKSKVGIWLNQPYRIKRTWDAYTTIDFVYSSQVSGWIIVGNPVLMSWYSEESGYEVKANGLITQWGNFQSQAPTSNINGYTKNTNLFVNHDNAKSYGIWISRKYKYTNNTDTNAGGIAIYNKTASSFSIRDYNTQDGYISWKTIGY